MFGIFFFILFLLLMVLYFGATYIIAEDQKDRDR